MRVVLPFIAFLFAIAAPADFPVVQPKVVADRIVEGAKPVIFQVGPNVLYRSKHIPGARYAGPASRPQGIEELKAAVEKLPRSEEIVIYCGCCPWDKCPNIKPAIELLKTMGFSHVTAMYVATNFKTDWIDHGYPVESGKP